MKSLTDALSSTSGGCKVYASTWTSSGSPSYASGSYISDYFTMPSDATSIKMIIVSKLNSAYFKEQYASSESRVYNFYPKVATNEYMSLMITTENFSNNLVMYSSNTSSGSDTFILCTDSNFNLYMKITRSQSYYYAYYSFSFNVAVFYE